ncbi:ROK family protein [Patescibacteria group bacterium AH-259-L05]|nr:ROK family protein [Patescibacteria group bacterium AH-259-L05]
MYIVLDIGGTSTRIASSKKLKTIDKIDKFSTIRSFDLSIKRITASIENITQEGKTQGIIIGLPGTIDKKTRRLARAPDLFSSWIHKPLTNILSKKFNCKIFIKNDTDLGGLGEVAFGAGKGHKIVGYYAIGTGLGGTRIVNKQIDVFSRGFEPGHQIINIHGEKWPSCGQYGCLESYVSGRAFYKNYGIQAENCKNEKIWNDFSKHLAQGIVNGIVLWSPDIFIIGGGFSQRAHLFLKQTRENVKKNRFNPPPIVKSKLGDKSGLYGGLHFLKTHK